MREALHDPVAWVSTAAAPPTPPKRPCAGSMEVSIGLEFWPHLLLLLLLLLFPLVPSKGGGGGGTPGHQQCSGCSVSALR